MQSCKECGASWDINRMVETCPFCGADLKEKMAAGTIEDVFSMILEKHGQIAFQGSRLLGLLGDYAPALIRERKLVKVAIESGAYEAICAASITERTSTVNKYVSILADSYFIDEAWARKALRWCLDAITANTSKTNSSVHTEQETLDRPSAEPTHAVASAITKVEPRVLPSAPVKPASAQTINIGRKYVETEFSDSCEMYRETILKSAEAQGKYKERTGSYDEYGVVRIRFEPYEGNSFVIEEAIFDASVPKIFFPAIEKGLYESAKNGILAGYPVVGVKATLCGGSYHPVASTENAFRKAANKAFADGISQAYPVLLEAVGILKAYIPDDKLVDIFDDINKRRGRILGVNPADEPYMQIVEAEVPLPEMDDYAASLRSITNERGRFTIEFAKYERVPGNIAQKVTKEATGSSEEEQQ